ncbi:hypothetical protein [Bosea sp. 117]|uniref:hypothetical protein n=1 Tax=Bosea sp. 117 TaxID=1125973 RepID=UPI00068A652B|nr:hypothetical protein [Bosea sp. 117]
MKQSGEWRAKAGAGAVRRSIELRARFERNGNSARTVLEFGGDSPPTPDIYFAFEGPAVPTAMPHGGFAVLAALPLAMRLDMDIVVDLPVERSLLENIDAYQVAWSRWRPDLFRPVGIRVGEETVTPPNGSRRAIASFSGGLDATYTIHAHRRRLLGRRSLDIEAAVLVQGFDLPLDRPDIFAAAHASCERILSHYDVPLSIVRTNWREVCVDWEMTFALAVATVLSQFRADFGFGVYSADLAYAHEVMPWGSNSSTNALLTSSGFPIVCTGFEASRTRKAAVVGGERPVLENLRVCWERPESLGNCGVCEKCRRTKLNFLAAGVDAVPALGPMPTVEEVRSIRTKSPISRYRNIVDDGDWSTWPEMRAAVEHVIASNPANTNQIFAAPWIPPASRQGPDAPTPIPALSAPAQTQVGSAGTPPASWARLKALLRALPTAIG